MITTHTAYYIKIPNDNGSRRLYDYRWSSFLKAFLISQHNTFFNVCTRYAMLCSVGFFRSRALSLCPFPLYLSYSIHQNSLRASVANTVFLVQFKNDNIIFDNILHSDNNSNKNYAILWWSIKYEWKNKARTNLSFLNMTTSETFAPNYAVARMYHTHNHIYIYF